MGLLLTIPLTAAVSSALYMGVDHFSKAARQKGAKNPERDKYYVEPSSEPSLFESVGDKEKTDGGEEK